MYYTHTHHTHTFLRRDDQRAPVHMFSLTDAVRDEQQARRVVVRLGAVDEARREECISLQRDGAR